MQLTPENHLAYCTNIHPAESWAETFKALKTHTLKVRNNVVGGRDKPFAIGLRLSAQAATDLLVDNAKELFRFEKWLDKESAYVFTINGFPYDDFHGVRVKEKVYQPDWSTEERLKYTMNLFVILETLCPVQSGGSVSTLPGSFKEFEADENLIFCNLYACARFLETLSKESGKDLHLGLEPEPLGHFENTEETIAFFERFHAWAKGHELDSDCLTKHIGINYDTCHFALEYDDCQSSLEALTNAGLRISKIHLSNALSIDPNSPAALERIKAFDEPTYLHQVLVKQDDKITRYKDLPDFFQAKNEANLSAEASAKAEARIHFHIPLYSDPVKPLGSTRDHAAEALAVLQANPELCPHLEIETYTWAVLPPDLQKPITDMISDEYRWVIDQMAK